MQTENFEKIEVRKTEELMIILNKAPKNIVRNFNHLEKITNEKPFYSIRFFNRTTT
jgi:hypothetical protein